MAAYDLAQRRLIDGNLTERAIGFMQQHALGSQPFFLYVPLTHLHFPTLPHPDFAGRSQVGDFADAMMEMDHRVGQLIGDAKPDHVVLMANSVTDAIIAGLRDKEFAGQLQVVEDPLHFYTNLQHFVAAGDVVLMQNDWTDNYS